MPKQPLDLQRKNEHLFLAEKFYNPASTNFAEMRLLAPSIPEMRLKDVKTDVKWFNFHQNMDAPLYINAMTGGNAQVTKLNQQLAIVAQELNIPIALGSMSNYLKYPYNKEISESYQVVREYNPQGLVIANVSAKIPFKQAQKCIDLVQANALQVHINAAQEIVMAEGEDDFCWCDNLAQLLQNIEVPVIIKEVGVGMNAASVRQILQLGPVAAFDISGKGGTNFQAIENERNHHIDYSFMQDWGLTTLESLLDIVPTNLTDTLIFASGGVRSPLDVIKCLVLGAHSVGLAAPVLHELQHFGLEHTITTFKTWQHQIKEIMTLLGCQKVTDLTQVDYRLSMKLNNFIRQKNDIE
ncbi:type 2 isopentenyl-diphosphate Delta-isomerase [Bombilactobacillus thymidiniphilus]|uniref:Isopentenyl-diphosphate delta-isomerase n=1 Tax=Bombilactobacillus thymidiniphilus TaxID=2923363 RepID=A0ABY4PDF6_9LACO|nr:type 2 isopentenyl-diphosphate Delta-isomerase [Bombilactobacillus thymidiniphilus]UQS83557.1 type 2 isopentenyl-diphosphate Delta-isomerase [Bombilactobacillus thymidiniphilus]